LNKVSLLLGSNIEPRCKYLEEAEYKLIASVGDVNQRSEIYESESFGFNADQTFLNRVLFLSSDLTAKKVLNKIHIIEQELGRIRLEEGYSSRTIDIDILYFNNEVIDTDTLMIPHPRMHERMFTLVPLAEIAPDFIHPIFHINSKELLDICPDDSKVYVFKKLNVL